MLSYSLSYALSRKDVPLGRAEKKNNREDIIDYLNYGRGSRLGQGKQRI